MHYSLILGCFLLCSKVFSLEKIVSIGANHTMVIDAQGQVWGWGKNNYARLGLGFWSDEVLTPHLSQIPSNIKITTLDSSQDQYTVALDEEGGFWYCGTWFDSIKPSALKPQKIYLGNDKNKAWQVFAAVNHGFVLDENSEIWALGKNYAGELGVGTIKEATNPIKIPFPQKCHITKIIAAKYISAALDDEGGVWAWGSNKGGILGFVPETNFSRFPEYSQVVPKKVPFGKGTFIKKIYRDDDFFYALDDEKKLWFWGKTVNCRQDNVHIISPQLLMGTAKVKKVYTHGHNKLLVLSDDGSVWQWNKKNSHHLKKIAVPNHVDIKKVFRCGDSNFMLDGDGKVYAWGENRYGQLGLLGVIKQKKPAVVSFLRDEKILHMVLGVDHSFFLDDEGVVWACGKNSNGELGIGSFEETSTVTKMLFPDSVKIQHIMGKNYHFIAVDDEGNLWSWGINHHGEVGIDHKEKIDRPIKLNIVVNVPQKHKKPIKSALSYY